MKYKDYYHGSYDRLPTDVQEGLKQQYGINDWATVSRLWDQERGVVYTPRPVQSQTNTPSFNRSTYEKGTYTLPSPATRAFNRLGRGISNAYNNFSSGLEDWARRNPNWGDATLNMSRAVVDAQNAGKDGLIAGTRAFVDTLDPTSQYNLERKQRIDAMDPAGAAHRELVRKTALDLGVSESEAERIIQEGNQKTRTKKQLELDKTIKELEQTPQQKLEEEIDLKIREYMLLNNVSYEKARADLAEYAAAMQKAELSLKIAQARKADALADNYKSRTALNGQKLKQAKSAFENKDLVSLEKTAPELYARFLSAKADYKRLNPGSTDETAEAAGWNAVSAEIRTQDTLNNLKIADLQLSIDNTIINLKRDEVELQKAIDAFTNRDLSKLTDQYRNIFIIQKNIAERKGVADPEGYAWDQTLAQLKRDAKEQDANIASTEAGTRQTNEKTQDMINARDVGNPANLPPKERSLWYQAYNNANGTHEQKLRNAWAFVIAGTYLEREDKQTSIELNQKKVEELEQKLENGGLVGLEGTNADYKIYAIEKQNGNFEGSYLDWLAKVSGYKNASELAAYIRAFTTGIKDEIASGKVVLSDGTVLEGEAARNMTEAQIEEEATYRASNLKVQMKKDVTTHTTSQKSRRDQREEAVKARDNAAVMARTADEALLLLDQTETIQHGPMQAIVNFVYSALYQLQWASDEMKAEVVAMDLVEQLTTKFALTAVQMTKGAISDKEMKSFKDMFLSPDKSKEAVVLRMKIIKHISLVSRDVNQAIIEENDRNENFVDGKKEKAIRDTIRAEYQGLTDEIVAEITQHENKEKDDSGTLQADKVTRLGKALLQMFNQGIANKTTVRSAFNHYNLNDDQIRELYGRAEFAGLKGKIAELFPRTTPPTEAQ